jgi:serine/threonine protein kinase HipA of HipAB toxin-antitoxin module
MPMTTAPTLRELINNHLDRLSQEQLQQVLAFVQDLGKDPKEKYAINPRELLEFLNQMSPEEKEAMREVAHILEEESDREQRALDLKAE